MRCGYLKCYGKCVPSNSHFCCWFLCKNYSNLILSFVTLSFNVFSPKAAGLFSVEAKRIIIFSMFQRFGAWATLTFSLQGFVTLCALSLDDAPVPATSHSCPLTTGAHHLSHYPIICPSSLPPLPQGEIANKASGGTVDCFAFCRMRIPSDMKKKKEKS